MPECPLCQGRGFVGFDLPRKDPRFGEIVPCSNCYPGYYEHPGTPVAPPEDLGECEKHNMKWRRFWNGGIGHTLTATDRQELGASPLWCIRGHKMTQAEFERWLELHGAEVVLGLEHREQGETWCHLHRQWERDDDLIDYPVSGLYLRYAAHCGLTPWRAWMDTPDKRDQQRAADWAEVVANSTPPTQAVTRGTMPQRYKGIKEAKPEKRQSVAKRPPTVTDAFRE